MSTTSGAPAKLVGKNGRKAEAIPGVEGSATSPFVELASGEAGLPLLLGCRFRLFIDLIRSTVVLCLGITRENLADLPNECVLR